MKKSIFGIALFSTLLLASCKQEKTASTTNQETTPATDSTSSIPAKDSAATAATTDIVKSTLKDKSGKTVEVTFDNSKDIATLVFNGENLELKGQRPASGIWYKNDHYELRGKGNDIQLSKDGKVVFENAK
ncbi:MliC family protein [Chryseobacterium capnotolerans]|uniref:MliC family protein n=1 Tax=Chryseobacterium TaxID=59732 RepID=UPI00083ABF25|nr:MULTISPECIES: MliC family protein [Chryseobacterium]UHO39187.1 MliC family protein [Chryseobacterium capnotolerans]